MGANGTITINGYAKETRSLLLCSNVGDVNEADQTLVADVENIALQIVS